MDVQVHLNSGNSTPYYQAELVRSSQTSRPTPEISIVLPVYNGAQTIYRAARSIFDQTLREIELIIVDDGSTDETVNVVRKLREPRLRVIESHHRGVVAAANTATEAAAAPFIARMDADDFAHPGKLEQQLQLLLRENLDAVGCQIRIVDESCQVTRSMSRYENWINKDTISPEQISALRFVEFPLVNPTILARRKYFELGYHETDLPEDYDLLLRAAALGFRFGKVPKVLFDWVDHAGRLTRTDSRYASAAFTRCRQKHLLAGPLHGASQIDLWGVGKTGKPWLRWLRDQNISIRHGYDVDKRKVNENIHGVRIEHPSRMPAADGTLMLVAVGAKDARNKILPQLQSRGHVSGHDAWFVA